MKPRPAELCQSHSAKKISPQQSKAKKLLAEKTVTRINSAVKKNFPIISSAQDETFRIAGAQTGMRAEVDAKSNGNHSEPLKNERIRKAAAGEQATLQNNPDALPVSGYPTKRNAKSAKSNPVDASLTLPAKRNALG